MKILLTLFLSVAGFFVSFSQQHYSVTGTVRDFDSGESLPYSTVLLNKLNGTQTDERSYFEFRNISKGDYSVTVRFFGYEELRLQLSLVSDTTLHFHLHPARFALSEVVVEAEKRSNNAMQTLSGQTVGRTYLLQNNSTNFVKTLSNIAGISSMDIGAGFSKPVIRGMGFNRVAVVDRGIVQQNQQWGADHGLEIDQFDVDNVTVLKGPSSLYFGSDAMGGVIEVQPTQLPEQNQFWGDATLIAKSNNDLIGTSVMASAKRNRWFFRGRVTLQQFGDYRIPTDTIEYLTWKMPVHNRRMKNTAGKEMDFSGSINYSDEKISLWLHVSDISMKMGFYPGAHGIPDVSRLTPDGSFRNIEMPYSSTNHFKLINNTEIKFRKFNLLVDAGFQQNKREEISLFHTHYGDQQPPEINPNTELSFTLRTYSLNARIVLGDTTRWTKTIGLSGEYQHNRVGGYSFLLPDFERLSSGAYWINMLKLNEKWLLSGGIRYDLGRLNIHGYFDETLSDYLLQNGYSEENAKFYAQRADNLDKTFDNFSASVGFVYSPTIFHTLKMNIGRSFRFPSANELASNGVHHGAFRHEKGNTGLQSEQGIQLDFDYTFRAKSFRISLNPFAAYFDNYIYLNPSGKWSILPHAGQIYEYEQAEAYMIGGEINANYRITEHWELSSAMEYVHNLNITTGYPLPFSPPMTIKNQLAYSGNSRKAIRQYSVRLENENIMAQNRISTNEEKTGGAVLWHFSANANWPIAKWRFITDFQVRNIFDTAFYNHLSFYRKLNAPEAGRNIQLILKIPF